MEEEEAKKVPIVVDRMENYTCADRIIRYVREGKIVFVRIGEFKNTNVDELRRTIGKIKSVVQAIDGDMVGVGNEWLVVAPSSARIDRNAQ
jgi:SepF-like predicted cell division protein (DUF552 family)